MLTQCQLRDLMEQLKKALPQEVGQLLRGGDAQQQAAGKDDSEADGQEGARCGDVKDVTAVRCLTIPNL